MEDFLYFTGTAKLIIIERALLKGKGNSKKEDTRKILTRLIVNKEGKPTSELREFTTVDYTYNENNQLILITEKEKSGKLLEQTKFYYSGENLTKKERTGPDGSVRETREYKYDSLNNIQLEKCGSRLYKYDYNKQNLLEKEYRYYGKEPEMALLYKNNDKGKITEIKTINSEGKQIRIEKFRWDKNLLLAHFCLNEKNVILQDDEFEYSCFHEGNWLKRVKYSLKNKNLREPLDVIYRSITFSDTFPEVRPFVHKNLEILKEEKQFLTFNDGSTYRGTIVDGKMDGNGYIQWADGSSYKGSFKGNKLDGKGILTWSNGDIYSGSFSNGQMEGIGRLRWNTGKTFYGIFENNRRTNQGIIEEE
jgi:hypothetical protein